MFLFNRFWSEKGQLVIPSTGVSSPGLGAVIDDTAPKLGGNLDVNGKSIVSVSDGDISITPDGTGNVILDGLKYPQTDGAANEVLQTDGAGQLSFAVPIWVDVPFNAGDFTALGAQTWTVEAGDVTTFKYIVSGKTMTIVFNIVTSSVGGTPANQLLITIPGSFVSTNETWNPYSVFDGVGKIGIAVVGASGTTIILFPDAVQSNWSGSTNTTITRGQITFEID